MSSGTLIDDKALETLLGQLLGSSHFANKPRLEHRYVSDGGYDSEAVAYDISLDALHDSAMKLYDALEFLNQTA